VASAATTASTICRSTLRTTETLERRSALVISRVDDAKIVRAADDAECGQPYGARP
jgi:hypothetical protein